MKRKINKFTSRKQGNLSQEAEKVDKTKTQTDADDFMGDASLSEADQDQDNDDNASLLLPALVNQLTTLNRSSIRYRCPLSALTQTATRDSPSIRA
jgi:hypothetical protein